MQKARSAVDSAPIDEVDEEITVYTRCKIASYSMGTKDQGSEAKPTCLYCRIIGLIASTQTTNTSTVGIL